MSEFDPVNHSIHNAVPRANYEQKKMRREWQRSETAKQRETYEAGWELIWGKKK